MQRYLLLLIIAICSVSLAQATATLSIQEQSSSNRLLIEKGSCHKCGKRGHKGHHGHRGHRGPDGRTGTQGAAGPQGPKGATGPMGIFGGVPQLCNTCPLDPISFTFTTRQNLALTGTWRVSITQPDLSEIPIVSFAINIQSPSTTFTITSTTPYQVGTYLIRFFNENIVNLNTPLVGGPEPILVSHPCFPFGNIIYTDAFPNGLPKNPGAITELYFTALPCSESIV